MYTNDSRNDGVVFRRFTDGRGQAEQVAANVSGLWAWSWSRDGTWVVAGTVADKTGFDLVRYDIARKTATPLVSTLFAEQAGALSPDERWLAYQSNETGRPEVYVRSLADLEFGWHDSPLAAGRTRAVLHYATRTADGR